MTGLRGLLGALQFLTRLPIHVTTPVPHQHVLPWFPIAGAFIGLIVGGVAAVTVDALGSTLAASLAVVTGLLVTGAFHEDGLADTADAFGGGWTREQRLEILKDSRHGTYGVAALASSIVVRVAALAALAGPTVMVAAAVAAHVLGRVAAVGALLVLPTAVDSGLGAGSAGAARRVPVAIGMVGGVAISVGVIGWWALPAATGAALAIGAVGTLAVRKIGGTVGDVLGAIEQVAEAAVLIVIAALAQRGELPRW
ncbi:MAG: adenosylcobinamide-GDP ribazoletransferase [Actinomycetota bacterium]